MRANDLVNLSSPVDTILDQVALQSRSNSYLLKQIDEADKGRYVNLELKLVKQGLKFRSDNKYLISKAIILYLKTNEAKQSLPLLRQHFQLFNNDLNELKNVANFLYEKNILLSQVFIIVVFWNCSYDTSLSDEEKPTCKSGEVLVFLYDFT